MARFATLLYTLLLALPACASTILVPGSGNESGLSADVLYRLRTTGSPGNINHTDTGFIGSASDTLSTASGVNYSGYLASLPVGATITGASLNFNGVFGASVISLGPVQSPPDTWADRRPNFFSTTLGAYIVTISSTFSAPVQVSGQAATGYNLWPQFMNDILAGNAIKLQWAVVDTFVATLPSSDRYLRAGDETFPVIDTRTFTASGTQGDPANRLILQYTTPGTAVPEPGTLMLSGMGLLVAAVVSRRLRRH